MKDQKFTYKQLTILQNQPFKAKVERAINLILSELQGKSRVSVACSFGKDSMVLLHLVLAFKRDVFVVFHNTGVQYPETYRYRDLILKEWNIKNYVETKPVKSFWACVDKYGFPEFRHMGRGKKYKATGGSRTPACCYYLKEKPAIKFIKEKNIELEFVGLQASESMVRRLSFFREGEVYDSKKYGCRVVRPLMTWQDDDIWQYHKLYEIPTNPLYEKVERNGCHPCTGFRGWKQQLARTNPKLYAYISNRMGQPLLSQYLDVQCGAAQ